MAAIFIQLVIPPHVHEVDHDNLDRPAIPASIASSANAFGPSGSFSGGKHVTYADFRIACVLPFADLAGLPLKDFPRVEAWHARLMDIPAWRDPFAGLNAPELPPIRTGAG